MIILLLCTVEVFSQSSSGAARKKYTLQTDDFEATIDEKGGIKALTELQSGKEIFIFEGTSIGGLYQDEVSMSTPRDNLIEVRSEMYDTLGRRSCTIVKNISVGTKAVHVEVRIKGKDFNWSAPIVTSMDFSEETNPLLWIAGSRNEIAGQAYNLNGEKIENDSNPRSRTWQDPLVARAFTDDELVYGSRKSDGFSKGFSLPLASVFLPEEESSVNVVFSPADTIINLSMKTDESGRLQFIKSNHRIGPDNEVVFEYDIFLDQLDWRPALKFVTSTYPEYFEPPLAITHEIAGCSSYSGYNGPMDQQKYKAIAYGFNWYASRSWPYLGMFLPDVPDNTTWQSWTGFGSGTATVGKTVSYNSINQDYVDMHDRGFKMLAYFNLNEFGYRVDFPFFPQKIEFGKGEEWKDSNTYLEDNFKGSILYTKEDRVRHSWNKSVIMDPGQASYKQYLIDQVHRHVQKIPDFDGICIDRLDWFEHFNYRRDDGVSWFEGRPVSSMAMSLHDVMDTIANVLHASNKVAYYNPHITRLDFGKFFDGVFDEFADSGNKINLSSFLALKKPMVGWIHSEHVLREEADGLIQKYLYLGLYPMAPYPEANHSLVASAWADSLFLDYGAMFKVLKGKEWVLEPHIVSANKEAAKVNMFKTNSGIVVPVMLAGEEEQVTIKVASPERIFGKKKPACFIIHPGRAGEKKIKYKKTEDALIVSTPLERGCAMLVFKN